MIDPIVQQSAAKYHVPAGILNGVYGMETGWGSDINTSSAGAMGRFQFIQGTAATYRYPYTNAQDVGTFRAQADAAAHYLADLYRQTGSWDSALKSYSGGGYGLAQVQAKAQGGSVSGGPSSGSSGSSGGIGALPGDALKALMFVALVGLGATLAYFGITRAAGVSPIKAAASSKAAKAVIA